MLADEPTANLDDAHAAAALELLRAQALEAGATLVVASHDAACGRSCRTSTRCRRVKRLRRERSAHERPGKRMGLTRSPSPTRGGDRSRPRWSCCCSRSASRSSRSRCCVARELEDRLTRDAAGIDLVVGAKGSPLQLVLAGVYHVDVPPGNIPLAAVAELRANPLIAQAIPLALGDSFRGFRIVGTEPALVEHYGGAARGRRAVDERRWRPCWAARSRARPASASGATFAGSHGLAEGGGEHGDEPYRVTGMLAPTGTVLDRLVLTSVESVWAVHDAHHGARSDDRTTRRARRRAARRAARAPPPRRHRTREVTMVLVRYAARSPRRACRARSTSRPTSSPRRRPTRPRGC